MAVTIRVAMRSYLLNLLQKAEHNGLSRKQYNVDENTENISLELQSERAVLEFLKRIKYFQDRAYKNNPIKVCIIYIRLFYKGCGA